MITLPWPPSKISPNGNQAHWRTKGPLRKAYRADCLWSIKAQRPNIGHDHTHLTITYCPPDLRRRDLDNLLAMTKHAIDALSEYAGIDDSLFTYTILRGDKIKGGAVQIECGIYTKGE